MTTRFFFDTKKKERAVFIFHSYIYIYTCISFFNLVKIPCLMKTFRKMQINLIWNSMV